MSIHALFSGKDPPVLEDFNEGPEFFDKFLQESNQRKLEVISTHVGLRRILDKILSLPVSYDKSESYARHLLSWGNRELSPQTLTASYKAFCHAIPHATGDLLVQALDARSSALLQLGLNEACITDIKMALEMECTEEQTFVLNKRLGICLTNLNQFREALEAFRNSESALQKMNSVSSEMKQEMKQLIFSSLSNAVTMAKLTGTHLPQKEENLPSVSHGVNKTHPYLSSAVELRWSESRGRELVSNKKLKPGDVLIVEPSYAAVLLKLKVQTDESEARLTRCSECIDTVVASIPCTQCIYVSYCSEKCRSNAWERFHRFECGHSKVLGYLDWAGRLALRVMLSIGDTLVAQVAVDVGCYDELSNVWEHDQGDDLSIKLQKRSEQEDCYRRIYGMVSHLGKESAWNNFKFHWVAFFISRFLLRRTDFFAAILPKDQFDRPKAKLVELAVAFRALLHLSQVVVNAMTVQDLWSNPCLLSSVGWGVAHGQSNPEEHSFSALGWNIPISRAIYLSASAINHSCYPNAKCSWYKNYVIVKATREIPPGEEVLVSYLGHDFREKELTARARFLKKNFYFDCACVACSNPALFPEKYFKAHRCLECEGPMLRMENSVISSNPCIKSEDGDSVIIKPSFQDSKKEKRKSKYKIRKVPQKSNVVQDIGFMDNYFVCQNCKAFRKESEDLHKICEGATHLSKGNVALKSQMVDVALSSFVECLRVYKKCLYKNHMRFVQILDMLGKSHAVKGDYLSALDCVMQSLPILEKLDFGNMLYGFQLQKFAELTIFSLMQMERSTVFKLKYKRCKECLSSAKDIYEENGGKWLWVMGELEKQERVLEVIGQWLKKDNGLSVKETIQQHFPQDSRLSQRFNYVFLYLDYWFSESLIS
ncbi:SET and MYND domain-containing protein 4-like [Ischnura elegans]|uniref:SET and MYND domain-containing protein 4-like n=1 Tax=Ischnura elegans TaxID=197161 RepID=UPI001ED86FA6|nr:SET and MYND domain-containing protein 4-like [Ischnura elegans]